MRAILAAAG